VHHCVARLRSAPFILGVLLLAACGGDGGGPSGPTPGIVFTSRRVTGFPNIWRMGPSEGAQQALTSVAAEEIAPTLSPDGRTIAFLTKRYTVVNQVALLDLETGDVTRLFTDSVGHDLPTWSPDGEWLAFFRAGGLYRIRPNGTGLALMKTSNSNAPSWSPDSLWMVYVGGNTEIRRLSIATGVDSVISTGTSYARPVWSPTGDRIAFQCTAGICLTNPDGSSPATVPGSAGAVHVGWSSDGVYLVFAKNIDTTGFAANYEIFRIRPNGTGILRLTTNGDASGGAADQWPAGGLLAP
jgi:Tol biopolymer transport system component